MDSQPRSTYERVVLPQAHYDQLVEEQGEDTAKRIAVPASGPLPVVADDKPVYMINRASRRQAMRDMRKQQRRG